MANMKRVTGAWHLQGSLLAAALASAVNIVLAQSPPDVTAGAVLEDIVVTARKREESVQDTPIAITAFSAEAIEARGITTTDEIARFVPNLTYQNNPGFSGSTNTSAIYIRGIGQFDYLGSIEPGVGTYVDGVYIGRSVGGITELINVERVEVLRGPQGTLFGRNTIGGAISITSRKPGPEPESQVSVTYGDDDRIEVRGSANLALTDSTFARLSVFTADRDGYVTRVVDGKELGDRDSFGVLGQLRFQPRDDLTFDASFDYTRDRSNGAPFVMIGINTASRIFNPDGRPYIPPRSLSPFAVDESERPLVPADALPPGANVPGAQGQIAEQSVPFLPPGVDPAASYYELNIQQAPGAPSGTFAPYDVPVDNFALLYNWGLTFPAPGGPAPVQCMSPAFEPYNATFSDADPCFSERFLEQNLGHNLTAATGSTFSSSEIWGVALTADWNAGPVEVVSITAYRDLHSRFDRDGDHSPYVMTQVIDRFDQWQVSQEVQVKGTSFDDRFDWIIGGYYFKEDVDNLNDVYFVPVSVRSGGLITNESYASYAQATYSVTDRLDFTAGIRFTHDSKDFDSGPYQFIFESRTPAFAACAAVTAYECPPETLTAYPGRDARQSASEWTPYVNVAYQWSDELMGYLSYSEGFKSGGFTQRIFPPLAAPPSVDPEFVKVYEGGIKSTWLDRRLRMNAAVFYTDYDDIQVQGFKPETGVAPIYVNGPSARIQGLELEVAASPEPTWLIEGSLGVLDDEYQSVPPGVIGLEKSDRFERVSKVTASVAVQKVVPLGSSGFLRPRLDVAYRSKFYNDASNLEIIAQDDYTVVNAAVTWGSADDRWSVTAGATNIFDEEYIYGAVYNASLGWYEVLPAREREWYLTLGARFQ